VKLLRSFEQASGELDRLAELHPERGYALTDGPLELKSSIARPQ
jgi:hypothetical protein